MNSYHTLTHPFQYELIEKRSRFIAVAAPVATEAEALAVLRREKEKYPDARHHVYAYRVRENNLSRYSDDGEPAKTAGMPVLEQLLHRDLTDAVIVVTRYFGGTLLGTGGLVRAYSGAAAGAVEGAVPTQMRICLIASLTVPYPLLARIQSELKTQNINTLSIDYTDSVTLTVAVPKDSWDPLQSTVTDLTSGTCTLLLLREEYAKI